MKELSNEHHITILPEEMSGNTDYVVVDPHLSEHHPDLLQAQQLGLKLVSPTEFLYEYFKDAKYVGNTATFPGFYAPQGRQLRLRAVDDQFLEVLNDLGVTNFEMETSAIYGMSKLLGHKAITINNVIANRRRGEFAADHHKSEKMMIEWVLERIIK